MKRTPLRRRTALKRSTTPLKRSPIRKRSKRREALYAGADGRRAFVKLVLSERRICEVRWENCTVGSQDVHEYITRGMGGAIVPGEQADRQGQRFFAVCRRCHIAIDEQPKRAKLEGFLKGTTA